MRGDDRSLTHDNQKQGELEAVLPFHLCSTPALTKSRLSLLVCLINKQLVMFSPHCHLNDHHFATFSRDIRPHFFRATFFCLSHLLFKKPFSFNFKYSAFCGSWVAEILSLMLARPLFLSSRAIKISRFHWCLICCHWKQHYNNLLVDVVVTLVVVLVVVSPKVVKQLLVILHSAWWQQNRQLLEPKKDLLSPKTVSHRLRCAACALPRRTAAVWCCGLGLGERQVKRLGRLRKRVPPPRTTRTIRQTENVRGRQS